MHACINFLPLNNYLQNKLILIECNVHVQKYYLQVLLMSEQESISQSINPKAYMSTLRNASSSNFTAPSRISGAIYLLVPTWERERERVIGRVVMATLIAHVVKGPHTIFKGFFTYFKKIKKIVGHKLAIMHDWSTAWTVFTHT